MAYNHIPFQDTTGLANLFRRTIMDTPVNASEYGNIEQKLDIIIDILTPKSSLILTGKSVIDEYNKLEIEYAKKVK